MLAKIDPATLEMPVAGLRLRGATLGAELAAADERGTLLCLLRHFGCIFCREMVRDIRKAADADEQYPRPVFVGQGDAEESQAFLDGQWPDAPMICDPDRALYRALGLGKGSIYQMFGPGVWACGVRASVKGNFIGKPVGDPWTMPGLFVVDRAGDIRWQHTFDHQGDHPNWSKIPQQLHPA